MIWVWTAAALLPVYISAIEPPTGTAKTAADLGFHGRVRSVHMEFSEPDGDILQPRKPAGEYLFDLQGRLIQETYYHYGDSGKLQSAQVFRYVLDVQGRVIEIDMFDKGAPPKDWQRHKQVFDSLGRCVEERDIGSDVDGSRTVYEYDSQGNAVTETEYNEDHTVFAVTEDKYDANHHRLSEKIIQTNPQETLERSYDLHGNMVDVLTYRNGVLESHINYVYEYDERGRMISVETIGSTQPGMPNVYGFCGDCGVFPGKTTYTYDASGRVIEERWFQPGDKLVRVDRPNYDDHGKVMQTAVYESGSGGDPAQAGVLKVDGAGWPYTWSNGWSNDTRTTKYSYDSHGNWIKSIVTSQPSAGAGKPKTESINYFTIEYY